MADSDTGDGTTERMRASVLRDVGEVTVEERERPEPGAGEVLVEVGATGVCMTDHHMYSGEFPVETPLVLGHESAGTVAESRVDGISAGERVAINPVVPCNACSACKRGRTNLCERNTVIGGAGHEIVDGAFAEYVRVPAGNVEPVGDLPVEAAAFAEPYACVVHGMDRAGVSAGDTVLVIGAGPIGLLVVQAARNRGAAEIVVSELDADRRALAADLGADRTVDPEAASLDEAVDPVDVAIEAVGRTETIAAAHDRTARGGRTLIFGVPPRDATLEVSPFDIYFEEIDLVGTYALTQESFERAVALLRGGRVETAPLVTAELGLDDLETAFGRMERTEGLKKLIRP